MQQLLQQPVYIRCDEITRCVDGGPVKDLEYAFPDIVEDIFGIKNQIGWGLLKIEYTQRAQEYDIIFKFLNPNGPMFRLCYKLMSDPYLKYKFDLSYLPLKIRQSIADGTASPFYMEKLEVDPRTRAPIQLRLNPFELYMFHFVYHVVNPSLRSQPFQETKLYTSLYLQLAEEYLCVFLPCDGSTVQPELPNHYISQSPLNRTIPQKPVRTPTLFRQEVLAKMQSPAVNTLQASPYVAGIWRSELIVQLCVDLWLSMPNGVPSVERPMWGYQDPSYVAFYQRPFLTEISTSAQKTLWSDEHLPSCEHLQAVRLLVKHLHYFANSVDAETTVMDQLKKVIVPSSQRRVYHFIRQTMKHWPLVSSFKQILEIWLSYIQPWRYMDFRTRYNRVRTESCPVDSRWLPFIAENLLVYSVIFHELIARFIKIDLACPRNAYMLFRLTKVFSQPNLCELLRQVEGDMEGMDGRGYSKWVQPHLVDLEGPEFQYRPIFQNNASIEDIIRMAKTAECRSLRFVDEEQKKEEGMTFWKRMFSVGGNKSPLMEQKNALIYLSASIKNLTNMFHIPEDWLERISKTYESTTTPSYVYKRKEEDRDVSYMKKTDIMYEGNPDLHPVYAYENTFLVRFLYYVCSWINYNYSSQILSCYTRRDVVGGVARQVLKGPQVVYSFDKRVPGCPVLVPYSLPPRLSLRPLANYYLLGYGSLLMLITMFFSGLSFTATSAVFLFLWIVFMVFRWMFGCAPVVPVVSVHDISASRLNESIDG